MVRTLRIGSRKSRLALVQTQAVRDLIEKTSKFKCEIVPIETKGDRIADRPLPAVGGKGLFTRELEERLLSGSLDLAVHSLKDLPTELPEGLKIAAVTEREDVRDALVSLSGFTLRSFPRGGRLATGSLRRRVQVQRIRPDIRIENLRGNVPTRISTMQKKGFDGIILAAAGLIRLKMQDIIGTYLDVEEMIPAAGQGALGIEIKEGSHDLDSVLSFLNHRITFLETSAERKILGMLGGSCQVPIGINARIDRGKVGIVAFVASLDGSEFIRESIEGDKEKTEDLSSRLVDRLLSRGAEEVIEKIKRSS